MTYSSQSGGFPQMPPHAVQIDAPTTPPSGGTAITAGVFGLLGGMFGCYLFLFGTALSLNVPPALRAATVLQTVGGLLMVITLVAGPILLFLRKRIGQLMVLAGSGLAIVLYLVCGILLITNLTELNGAFGRHEGAASLMILVILLVLAVPAIATFVLAIVPATTRYVRWRPGQGAMYGSSTQSPYPPMGDSSRW